jgi:hypothetical protein
MDLPARPGRIERPLDAEHHEFHCPEHGPFPQDVACYGCLSTVCHPDRM